MRLKKLFKKLSQTLSGELFFDDLHRVIYATDASVYRNVPKAVAYPRNTEDIKKLVTFATKNDITLIPRTAGTSLAGQCVGGGIVVDISKYFTNIIALNKERKTVTLQPGVIRDDLNSYLKPYGLFFGPNTSTSNRCMIGGMVANNSSGTTSIQYGVTRDKTLEIKAILSDNSEVVFRAVSVKQFYEKTKGDTLESRIYKKILSGLCEQKFREVVKNNFPRPEIHRRSTGYAIDILSNSSLFGGQVDINLCNLLCGSEGTLAFFTEITLQLDDLPPSENIMVISQFESLKESLQAVKIAMKHNLYTCELMDKTILEVTKNNREQAKNRYFIQGDPEAILMLEVRSHNMSKTQALANKLIADLERNGFGYKHFKLKKADISRVINLRKAGLGLLGNMIGDKKAVACIEDTAVTLEDLPSYIEDFTQIMEHYGQECIYYAHAGAGELHLRPILNLKKREDVNLFKKITKDVALLVKKYRGFFEW